MKWLTAVLVLLAALATGCGTTAAPADLDRVRSAGVVRVCSTGDYRPFTYRDPQGAWSGLDVDLAGDLAKRLGVRLEWVPTTWSALVDDLDAKCDLAMGGITITLDRAQQARFSSSYLDDGKAAIVRCADAARYRSLADVDQPGVRVVVNPGGTNEEFDRTHLVKATVIGHPDNNTIFEQITGGKADAMITDASEIRWQSTRDARLCGVAVDHPFTFAQKAYLVPRSAEMTQQWVDQWLTQVRGDGTFAALSQKWLGHG